MTQTRPVLTSFAIGALTVEAANAVDAGGPVEASRPSAVVDVDAAVGTGPAVDADARVAAMGVGASGPVVANRGPGQALVDVELALRPGERRRTQTRVLVDPVHASGAILTEVTDTVVYILFAVVPSITCKTNAKTVKLHTSKT